MTDIDLVRLRMIAETYENARQSSSRMSWEAIAAIAGAYQRATGPDVVLGLLDQLYAAESRA